MFKLIRKSMTLFILIFLMLSSVIGAGIRFVFWVIAARFYSAEDVGLASAIVSAMRMIGMLSVLGLDLALIRFIPEKEKKSETVNSALVITQRNMHQKCIY